MKRNTEFLTAEPGAWIRQIFPEFDRLFDERAWPFFRMRPREYDEFPWKPEFELFERDNQFVVRVDLPGLAKEDVKVEVVEGVLTIAGERKHETKAERPGWYSSERTYGKFYRAIPLPEGVNAAEITGAFTNGVLEVTIPVPAKAVAPPSYKVPIEETTQKKIGKAAA
jgi:HSP20 family protein